MNNAHTPATPTKGFLNSCSEVLDYQVADGSIFQCIGLTKRETFAMHFHAALLTATFEGQWTGADVGAATVALKEADKLLEALDGGSK